MNDINIKTLVVFFIVFGSMMSIGWVLEFLMDFVFIPIIVSCIVGLIVLMIKMDQNENKHLKYI